LEEDKIQPLDFPKLKDEVYKKLKVEPPKWGLSIKELSRVLNEPRRGRIRRALQKLREDGKVKRDTNTNYPKWRAVGYE